MDRLDKKILAVLQANARASLQEIGQAVGLSPSPCWGRIKKMEEAGVIQGYTIRIDPRTVGLGLTAFILVRTEERVGSGAIGEALARLPEVLERHHVAGEDCYLVKVRVADTEALSRLLRDKVGRLKGVRNTRSTIVLSTAKEGGDLPLPDPEEVAHGA